MAALARLKADDPDLAEHHNEMIELHEQFANGEITPEEFNQAMIEEAREAGCPMMMGW